MTAYCPTIYYRVGRSRSESKTYGHAKKKRKLLCVCVCGGATIISFHVKINMNRPEHGIQLVPLSQYKDVQLKGG